MFTTLIKINATAEVHSIWLRYKRFVSRSWDRRTNKQSFYKYM